MSQSPQQRGIPKVRRHALSLAFTVTYNKVQGQTLSRVVLVLATPKGARLWNLAPKFILPSIEPLFQKSCFEYEEKSTH